MGTQVTSLVVSMFKVSSSVEVSQLLYINVATTSTDIRMFFTCEIVCSTVASYIIFLKSYVMKTIALKIFTI